MERLTTDNPQTNFQTLMNYAYAKDGLVYLRHADGEDEIKLTQYIASRSIDMCGGVTAESVMDGECMECHCPLGIINTLAVQAAELRGRLKAIEDILGPDYDMTRLRELAGADREGCPYCNDGKELETDGGGELQVVEIQPMPAINLTTGQKEETSHSPYMALWFRAFDGEFEDFVPIRRCPMCGRILKGRDNHGNPEE